MNQSKQSQSELERALALHRGGRMREAEGVYRGLLATDSHHPDASHLLGVLLTQTGRAEEAVSHLRRAVQLAPAQAEFHANLARAHHALGHIQDALPPMRRASELAPHSADHLCALGALLQDDGHLDEAVECYQAALKRHPGHITSRYNLATAAHQSSRTAQAAEMLSAMLREQPRQPALRTTLAGYLLELDRELEALEACDAALQTDPRDLMAMSLKSVALLRLGRRAEAERLLDLDRLISVSLLQVPPGFEDLGAFNCALTAHILSHPTLVPSPRRNATRNGRHTENLLRDRDKGPMKVLEGILDARVAAYLQGLPHDPGHPYLARRPARWRLQAWAVVMDCQGHQLAHTHPDGWVSGVYYAETPAEIRDDDDTHAGWIEFGRPLPALIKDAVPITRMLRPREGMLVLFPSFLYHETVSFDSPRQRISIAFDAVPR